MTTNTNTNTNTNTKATATSWPSAVTIPRLFFESCTHTFSFLFFLFSNNETATAAAAVVLSNEATLPTATATPNATNRTPHETATATAAAEKITTAIASNVNGTNPIAIVFVRIDRGISSNSNGISFCFFVRQDGTFRNDNKTNRQSVHDADGR